MFELYVRCPRTGEPVYAGIQASANSRTALRNLMKNCPSCGARHEWSSADVCLETEVSPSDRMAWPEVA